MKLVIGITGASGVGLGLKFLNLLPQDIEVFCVISQSAKTALQYEEKNPLPNNSNILFYDDESIGACIASGSFKTDAMIILPCSMNTSWQ
jgi:4-hydroxy-3-polyprenylbenzoate decarboxylase